MIFDTFVKLYETDTIHEFKEKIFTNFCQDYCISAINDIRIQNGKLYGDVPEYNRNDFIDAYVEQILSVTLDKKMIDILSTESADDSSIKMITYTLLHAAMNQQEGKLLSNGLKLIDIASSQGIVKAIKTIEKRTDTKYYENNLLLSMKYANDAGAKNAPERLVHLLFTTIIMHNTKCTKEEIKEFIEISCVAISNYLEAFIIREYECEIVAENMICNENVEIMTKNANEISEFGFAKYKEAFARSNLAEEIYNATRQKQQIAFKEFMNDTLARYHRIITYSDFDDYEMNSEKKEDKLLDINRQIELSIYSDYKNSFLAGGMALGTGIVVATVGGFTLFGTAATGTAIASLHGSAYVGSLLSSIGGGALSIGGLGIAGGIATLAGLFAIPVVAYVGTKISNQKIKNAEDSKRYYRNATRETCRLNRKSKELLAISENMQYVTYEVENLKFILNGIIDILEQSLLDENTETVHNLKEGVEDILKSLFHIEYTDIYGNFSYHSKKQIDTLHKKIIHLQKQFGEYLGQMGKSWQAEDAEICVRPLENEEIRHALLNSFTTAQETLYIISPWISGWVMDPFMDALMTSTLKRGVSIKILYGIGNLNGSDTLKEFDKKRNDSTDYFAEKLKNKYKKYGTNFSMQRGNTHGKLLICDETYYIIGSYNFLSFDGDYSTADVRHEMGDYSENRKQIAYYKKRYFDF